MQCVTHPTPSELSHCCELVGSHPFWFVLREDGNDGFFSVPNSFGNQVLRGMCELQRLLKDGRVSMIEFKVNAYLFENRNSKEVYPCIYREKKRHSSKDFPFVYRKSLEDIKCCSVLQGNGKIVEIFLGIALKLFRLVRNKL